MEVTHDTIFVGVREYLLVETHGLLLVAGPEVHLDTAHAHLLHPLHLLLAGDGV